MVSTISNTRRDWCPETGEDLLVVASEKCKANCDRYNECWASLININVKQ